MRAFILDSVGRLVMPVDFDCKYESYRFTTEASHQADPAMTEGHLRVRLRSQYGVVYQSSLPLDYRVGVLLVAPHDGPEMLLPGKLHPFRTPPEGRTPTLWSTDSAAVHFDRTRLGVVIDQDEYGPLLYLAPSGIIGGGLYRPSLVHAAGFDQSRDCVHAEAEYDLNRVADVLLGYAVGTRFVACANSGMELASGHFRRLQDVYIPGVSA